MPSQLSGSGTLRQLSTGNSDDDGGGDYNGVRCSRSMTAQDSSCRTDMADNSHTDSCCNRMSHTDYSRSHNRRMGSSHIGNPDNQIRLRLLQHQP